MKLLLVVTAAERAAEVHAILDRHGVAAFTEITEVRGTGETGAHLGTRAFPGTSHLIFSVVPREIAGEVAEGMALLSQSFDADEALSAFVLDVEQVL